MIRENCRFEQEHTRNFNLSHTHGILYSGSRVRSTRWPIGRIDDIGSIGVQFPQPIDERKSFGCAIQAWFTDRVVPHQRRNVSLKEERSNRRSARVESEFGPTAKVKYPVFGIDRWGLSVEQRPASVKDGFPKIRWDVDCLQIGRAESRHKEDKLQIRHVGVLDIERGHRVLLSRVTPDESTRDYEGCGLPLHEEY